MGQEREKEAGVSKADPGALGRGHPDREGGCVPLQIAALRKEGRAMDQFTAQWMERWACQPLPLMTLGI